MSTNKQAPKKIAERLLSSLALVLKQYDDYGQINLEVIEQAEAEIQNAIAAGITVEGDSE